MSRKIKRGYPPRADAFKKRPGTVFVTAPGTIKYSLKFTVNYSIGAPATLVNLMTPLSSTKKIRVPVVPLTAGFARHVYWFTFTNA